MGRFVYFGYSDMSDLTSLKTFVTGFAAHIAAEEAS